jgi:hypothetical protein
VGKLLETLLELEEEVSTRVEPTYTSDAARTSA